MVTDVFEDCFSIDDEQRTFHIKNATEAQTLALQETWQAAEILDQRDPILTSLAGEFKTHGRFRFHELQNGFGLTCLDRSSLWISKRTNFKTMSA